MVLSIKQALGKEKELSFISDSSLLDTEIILSFVMRQTREYVRAHDDVKLSLTEESSFRKFLERRNNAYFVKKFSRSHWRKSQKCFLSKRISQ